MSVVVGIVDMVVLMLIASMSLLFVISVGGGCGGNVGSDDADGLFFPMAEGIVLVVAFAQLCVLEECFALKMLPLT